MGLEGKKGVDLSSLNGDVDIEAVKRAGYDFAMLRCGYGSTCHDRSGAHAYESAGARNLHCSGCQ